MRFVLALKTTPCVHSKRSRVRPGQTVSLCLSLLIFIALLIFISQLLSLLSSPLLSSPLLSSPLLSSPLLSSPLLSSPLLSSPLLSSPLLSSPLLSSPLFLLSCLYFCLSMTMTMFIRLLGSLSLCTQSPDFPGPRHTRCLANYSQQQEEFVKVFLWKPRATWNEVGLSLCWRWRCSCVCGCACGVPVLFCVTSCCVAVHVFVIVTVMCCDALCCSLLCGGKNKISRPWRFKKTTSVIVQKLHRKGFISFTVLTNSETIHPQKITVVTVLTNSKTATVTSVIIFGRMAQPSVQPAEVAASQSNSTDNAKNIKNRYEYRRYTHPERMPVEQKEVTLSCFVLSCARVRCGVHIHDLTHKCPAQTPACSIVHSNVQ